MKNIIPTAIVRFLSKSKTDNLQNRLIKGAFGSFGLKIANAGLLLVISVILARLLGSQDFGIYAYAIAWSNLLSIPAVFGLDKLLVREVAIYRTRNQWELMRGLLDWSNRLVLMLSVAIALFAGTVAWSFGKANRQQMLLALCIAFISLPIASLRSLRLAAMKGLHNVVLGQLPEMLIAPLLLIVLNGICYLILQEEFNSTWVVTIYVVSISITFVIGAWFLHDSLPNAFKNVTAQYQIKNWISSALPLMLLGGMQIIYFKTDVIILGGLKGTESVGIYVVVTRLAQLITFMLGAVDSILAPNIASLYAEQKIEEIQYIVTKSTRIVLVISVVFTGCIVGLSDWLLLAFGTDFTQGKIALNILSLGQLINVITGAAGQLLLMAGYERFLTIISGISALLNIVLNILLIPRFGINGAAIATAISMIFRKIIVAIWAQKQLGINPTGFKK